MSRWLTQPCSYSLVGRLSSSCQCLHPSMGAVRKNFDDQVTFYPLTSLGAIAPRPSSSVVTLLRLLSSDSSRVMIALAQIVPVFSSVCIELQRRGPLNLLHSDSSPEVSILARLNFVIVYFFPLQLSLSSYELDQCSAKVM